MNLLKNLLARVKQATTKNQTLPVSASPTTPPAELAERLARLERNYLVLLKRVLAMDGIELQFANGKTKQFNQRILKTENDKGLNEPKPTYH